MREHTAPRTFTLPQKRTLCKHCREYLECICSVRRDAVHRNAYNALLLLLLLLLLLVGQAASLVRCVANCLTNLLQPSQQQQQGGNSSSSSSSSESDLLLLLPLLCEPLPAVLDALPADLATATSVAAAVQQLLGSSSSSNGGGGGGGGAYGSVEARLWQPLAAAAAAGQGLFGSSSSTAQVQLLLRLLASCIRCV
jgi:hypothetical protein